MSDEFSSYIEPTAKHRSAAREMYQFFVAMRQQGFTETQALSLISDLLTSSVNDQEQQDE